MAHISPAVRLETQTANMGGRRKVVSLVVEEDHPLKLRLQTSRYVPLAWLVDAPRLLVGCDLEPRRLALGCTDY